MSISENLKKIEEEISKACEKSGRPRSAVHLLAVSKTQPVSAIEEAFSLGVRNFGENYVQELLEKREKLSHLKEIRWHLIGPLQTNKIKTAIQSADFFHALENERQVAEIRRRNQSRKPWQIFIQINIDEENTKSGILLGAAPEFIQKVRMEPAINLLGLMCIPEQKSDMRPTFRKMAKLRAQIDASLQLSMGMSEDFETAIEEGSNWVRIGRKLFGERIQRR